MATFVTITDTQLDPDAPLTSALAYQFRDNPASVWEGDVSAPAIDAKAYEAYFGESAVSGTGYYDYTDLGKSDVIVLRGVLSGATDNGPRVRVSDDGGATWSSAVEPATTTGGAATFDVIIYMTTGRYFARAGNGDAAAGTFGVTNIDAVSFGNRSGSGGATGWVAVSRS
jgi:hypothetical protein